MVGENRSRGSCGGETRKEFWFFHITQQFVVWDSNSSGDLQNEVKWQQVQFGVNNKWKRASFSIEKEYWHVWNTSSMVQKYHLGEMMNKMLFGNQQNVHNTLPRNVI